MRNCTRNRLLSATLSSASSGSTKCLSTRSVGIRPSLQYRRGAAGVQQEEIEKWKTHSEVCMLSGIAGKRKEGWGAQYWMLSNLTQRYFTLGPACCLQWGRGGGNNIWCYPTWDRGKWMTHTDVCMLSGMCVCACVWGGGGGGGEGTVSDETAGNRWLTLWGGGEGTISDAVQHETGGSEWLTLRCACCHVWGSGWGA